MLPAAQHTSQPPISSARIGRVTSSRCSLPRSLFDGHAGPTALRVRQASQKGREPCTTPSRCLAPPLCGIIQRLLQLDRHRCFRAWKVIRRGLPGSPLGLGRGLPGRPRGLPRPFWRGSIQRCACSSRPRWPLTRDLWRGTRCRFGVPAQDLCTARRFIVHRLRKGHLHRGAHAGADNDAAVLVADPPRRNSTAISTPPFLPRDDISLCDVLRAARGGPALGAVVRRGGHGVPRFRVRQIKKGMKNSLEGEVRRMFRVNEVSNGSCGEVHRSSQPTCPW